MKNRNYLLALLCLFLTNNFFAQKSAVEVVDKKTQRKERKAQRQSEMNSFFVLEGLGTYRTVQDLATSNQIYTGFGGGLGLGGFRVRGKAISEYQMRGGYNGISSQAGLSTDDFWGNFSFSYLRQINTNSNYVCAVGGQADILTQVRYTANLGNSGLHWDLVGSLGLAARIHKDITLPFIKKNVQAFGQAHLPLVAYIGRPIYGVTIDGMMENYVSTIGRFRRIDMEWGILFPFRKNNPNRFRISYQWDIFRWRDNEIQRVITGHHYLSFAVLMRMI